MSVESGRCASTVTELWADARLWQLVRKRVIERAVGRRVETRIWCSGPRAAADAISLVLTWDEAVADEWRRLRVLATDTDAESVEEAFGAAQPESLREDHEASVVRWFEPSARGFVAGPALRARVALAPLDLWTEPWPRQLDMIFMRDSVFTTADEPGREVMVERAVEALRPHGFLALGRSESLPAARARRFYRVDQVASLYLARD